MDNSGNFLMKFIKEYKHAIERGAGDTVFCGQTIDNTLSLSPVEKIFAYHCNF